jgi:predicted nuclease of restriction endonuclease-like RecB superfamily
VDVPDAAWLLHRYNVALVQSLLLHAGELVISLSAPAPARLRQLLRAVKFHQLIHAVTRAEDGWQITVDGPASCLSQGTRYGMALARFFPALLLLPTAWSLRAEIAAGRGSRTLTLASADGLRSHYRDVGGWEPQELVTFIERWNAADTGWELSTDAPPLRQGPQDVVVPDLCFRKDGRVAQGVAAAARGRDRSARSGQPRARGEPAPRGRGGVGAARRRGAVRGGHSRQGGARAHRGGRGPGVGC